MEEKPKKDLLLSLSEHTLVSALDEDGMASLHKIRKQILEQCSSIFGDSKPTPVEMLAFPLQLVPDLVDPIDIKVDLEPTVGISNWPLTFLISKLGVAKDICDSSYYVTAEVHPDHSCKVTLECQFFRGHPIQPYPPIRLFKLSDAGWSAADKVYNGIVEIAAAAQIKRIRLPVQVRNLVLVTPHQCFKLRLCGLEAEQNCLQWHDVTKVPSGYQDRDFLARFRNWGPENRLQTEGNLDLTEAQAATPLGRMCPWMNQFMFKTKWQELLPSQIQLVATPGTVSRTDRILSLIDTPNTTRLIRDSIQANFRLSGDGAAEQYLKQVLELNSVEVDVEVDLAVKLLGSLLEQKSVKQQDVRHVRWTEQGFDRQGRMLKRFSYPESGNAQQTNLMGPLCPTVPQPMGTVAATGNVVEESRGMAGAQYASAGTVVQTRPQNRNGRRSQQRSQEQQEFMNDYQAQLETGDPPYNIYTKLLRQARPRPDWAAKLQLPAPGADRKWRRLVEAIHMDGPVTAAKLKGMLLSPDFQLMLQDLEPTEQAGMGVNLLSLFESLKSEPELAMAMYEEQDIADQFPDQTFNDQQLKIIRDYANVLRLAAASRVVPGQFEALKPDLSGVESGEASSPPRLLPAHAVMDTFKRISMAGVRELAEARGVQNLNGQYQMLMADWDEVMQQATPTAPVAPAGSESERLRQEVVAAASPWEFNPEWKLVIDGLNNDVRKGRDFISPVTAARYQELIGGPPRVEYQFENAEGATKHYPPIYKFLPNQELWSLVAQVALYIAQPEALSTVVRSEDLVNAWMLLSSQPDRSPDLVAAMQKVEQKLEDAKLTQIQQAAEDISAASRSMS